MARSKLLRRLAMGAAIAGAAGYVAGVLSAPAKGAKTRKELKKSANSSLGDVEKQLKQLHNELGEIMADTKGKTDKLSGRSEKKLSEALRTARTTKEKLRDVISSVREGEASNKDLAKALEDAKRSLDHLKHFIKK